MSAHILFLAHRPPFPPDRGDKIRSHHLLRALRGLAPTHVGCLDDGSMADGWLRATATSHCVAAGPWPPWRAGPAALASGRPVSETAFDNSNLHGWVARTLDAHPIDTIVIFSGQMGQYVPENWRGRLIVDLCDVDSAKFEAYARTAAFPRSWIDQREARLLRSLEASLVARADATLLVSEAEAALLRDRAGDAGRIVALGNGIDTEIFAPAAVETHPELANAPGPHLLFTGQMDYPPNVAACERVIADILPAIRERHLEVVFHVVGRSPAASLKRHDRAPGVRVWGEVPDTRPFLAAADVVLAPLTIARGVQNKVLEAMAMARPVVASVEAATGIGAMPGRDFLVGEDNRALAAATLSLLGNASKREEMGRSARAQVRAAHGWDAMLEPLAALTGRAGDREPRRAA